MVHLLIVQHFVKEVAFEVVVRGSVPRGDNISRARAVNQSSLGAYAERALRLN